MSKNREVYIIGGGLAGSECALKLVEYGYHVKLLDMKPIKKSPAHHADTLCELVCSNSLKSEELSTGSGTLKRELDILSSSVLRIARSCAVPAGSALAVDRDAFSRAVTQELIDKGVEIIPKIVSEIEDDKTTVIATGPLSDEALDQEIERITGKRPYFFDAAAPIVSGDSIDMEHAFFGGRYGKGGDDYLNLPMDKEEYLAFWKELVSAECAEVKDFEGEEIFEGCMPIEVMAKRGEDTLRFGPLRPVGFTHKGKRPYAVLQLRREDEEGKLFNLVGFQTHLKFPEQKRVFSLIPGLKNAEFMRYGVMHRNTYINLPKVVDKNLKVKGCDNLYFAGQITGVEGYMESVMSGLVTALKIVERDRGVYLDIPDTTITGALIKYVTEYDSEDYQPMNANFGILPELSDHVKDKKQRKLAYAERAVRDMTEYSERRKENGI
ncbi:MAG: methylenetetrahydrofolate--tRNA-(uracil(54)-C(5))-methyltransferase (FADH(2)-oxidizing) TrmFO [Clostridia bacterium]|nr:methylenetetrahydrofolate--tRNA-(uracil(54)-C(5))-methyltransferase (FADH(2)-oxidizing) TrmFO [Clostridia bacterium]